MSKKNILKSVTMDTETTFHVNGDVSTLPNGWEEYKAPVTVDGHVVAMRGKMEILPNGGTFFKAYREGTGPKYTPVYTVLNGVLKTTKNEKKVIVLSFRSGLTDKQVADAVRKQGGEIANYIEYRRR